MATHNITITTTDEQEAQAQALQAQHGGITFQQMAQDNSNKILDAYERNTIDQWWNGLSQSVKRTIYNANQE